MAKKTEWLAPFDKNGNLQHYPESWGEGEWRTPEYKRVGPDWRKPENFTARLTVDHMMSGRSAKYVMMNDEQGHVWPMFIKDLVEAIHLFEKGVLAAEFTISKRGMNFGVRVYGLQAQDQKSA